MIKVLVLDVDGTLTDGKIYMGASGEMMKAFHVKDGYAMNHILPNMGIVPTVITGRTSTIVENRCKELHIEHLYQGVGNKKRVLEDLLQLLSVQKKEVLSMENVAYCGDDTNDLECMNAIKEAGGLVGCPKDAIAEVQSVADFIASKNGGEGAVREFIRYIFKNCDSR